MPVSFLTHDDSTFVMNSASPNFDTVNY